MTELYELCTKFDICSAPKCPLDSEYHTRTVRQKGEEKCIARKRTRLRIVRENPEYDVPFKGYTSKEYGAVKNFNLIHTP